MRRAVGVERRIGTEAAAHECSACDEHGEGEEGEAGGEDDGVTVLSGVLLRLQGGGRMRIFIDL